jgi:hypothetical protein
MMIGDGRMSGIGGGRNTSSNISSEEIFKMDLWKDANTAHISNTGPKGSITKANEVLSFFDDLFGPAFLSKAGNLNDLTLIRVNLWRDTVLAHIRFHGPGGSIGKANETVRVFDEKYNKGLFYKSGEKISNDNEFEYEL